MSTNHTKYRNFASRGVKSAFGATTSFGTFPGFGGFAATAGGAVGSSDMLLYEA